MHQHCAHPCALSGSLQNRAGLVFPLYSTVSMLTLICLFAGRLSGMLQQASSRAEHRTGHRCACPSCRQRGVRLSGTPQTLSRQKQMLRQAGRSRLRAQQRRLSLKLQADRARSSGLVQGVLLRLLFAHRAPYAAWLLCARCMSFCCMCGIVHGCMHLCVYGLTILRLLRWQAKRAQIAGITHACAPEDCGEAWRKTGLPCWQT